MNTATNTSVLSASPKIKPCSCKHEFQDSRYGVGMRVHNPCKNKGGDGIAHRCTVCKTER